MGQTGNGTSWKHLPEIRPMPAPARLTLNRDPLKSRDLFREAALPPGSSDIESWVRCLPPGRRVFLRPATAPPLEELLTFILGANCRTSIPARLVYGDTSGFSRLVTESFPVHHLPRTRGLKTTATNILTASQEELSMGILSCRDQPDPPGIVWRIDAPGWFGAPMNFAQAGARVYACASG